MGEHVQHAMQPGEDCDDGEAAVAAALVGRVQNGDRAAEQAFVARYRRGLVLVLRKWTGDAALAEDVAQDTLLIAIERLRDQGLEEPGKLLAFLRRTAHNLVVAGGRKAARRRTQSAGDDLPDAPDLAPDHVDQLAADQEAALVRRVIAELAIPRDRELLRRHYLADEDKAAICAELGLDELHFNRVLHRARQRFAALWNASRPATEWDTLPPRDSNEA